ncbi:hypothetical protein Ddye_018870 [Dipteronia dyeriana]|uniref:C2H2-type domain-containing protein n=1 Tax=Dipteronia dyeriana TaxID=168575 RepID=A0AAD9TXQ4_9ROSI|nr:hypothetical protein Ddye_018870 [Dipteronia dyeriana]
MAGFGWILNRDRKLSRKRPYPTPQIACRFCDQVFMSPQALIHHIDTHIIEDVVMAGRQHEMNLMMSQRDHHLLTNPSRYQPNFPMATTPLCQPIEGFFHHPHPNFPHSTSTPPSQVVKSGRLIPPLFWVKNFSQQRPEPPTDRNPSFFSPKPPTNVPEPVRPQVGRDNESHSNMTSDDIETVDLTLRL